MPRGPLPPWLTPEYVDRECPPRILTWPHWTKADLFYVILAECSPVTPDSNQQTSSTGPQNKGPWYHEIRPLIQEALDACSDATKAPVGAVLFHMFPMEYGAPTRRSPVDWTPLDAIRDVLGPVLRYNYPAKPGIDAVTAQKLAESKRGFHEAWMSWRKFEKKARRFVSNVDPEEAERQLFVDISVHELEQALQNGVLFLQASNPSELPNTTLLLHMRTLKRHYESLRNQASGQGGLAVFSYQVNKDMKRMLKAYKELFQSNLRALIEACASVYVPQAWYWVDDRGVLVQKRLPVSLSQHFPGSPPG